MNLVFSSCFLWCSIRLLQEDSRKRKTSRKGFLIEDSWLEVLSSRRNREEFFVCSSSSRMVLEEVLGGFHGKAFLGFQRFKKEFLDCLNLKGFNKIALRGFKKEEGEGKVLGS